MNRGLETLASHRNSNVSNGWCFFGSVRSVNSSSDYAQSLIEARKMNWKKNTEASRLNPTEIRVSQSPSHSLFQRIQRSALLRLKCERAEQSKSVRNRSTELEVAVCEIHFSSTPLGSTSLELLLCSYPLVTPPAPPILSISSSRFHTLQIIKLL